MVKIRGTADTLNVSCEEEANAKPKVSSHAIV
jgi:hypothetical protein